MIKIIKQVPVNMIGSKKISAADNIFKMDRNAKSFSSALKDKFCELTAKTVWLSQQARLDL